jgi:L-ascorbate metabolism protein UlaG (beta-lactamase superfamily)
MKKIAPFLVFIVLLLAACGGPVKTAEPTPTPKPAEPTPTPTAAGVILTYEDNAQVELVTPAGRHIYLDVTNPSLFIKQPTADDILLTTHLHTDHYYRAFADAFPGQQILASTGKIELPDVTITGIASGHNASDPLLDKGGTNYIYIIDVGGLRIAHFGDIGQEALTDDQLAALGSVDIAIMQFDNSFSNMNATNMKGFHLMDQVKPRLIIPSAHVSMPTIQIAVGRWTGYFAESRTVMITPDNLPAETSILALGNMATVYNTLYHLKAWK